MKKKLTHDEVLELMRKRQGDRTASAYAEELGISAPYLSDIYAKKRDPGPTVLERLGLEPEKVYTPAKEQSA